MEIESTLGAALPGYEIGGELGRGAFGVVVAGRHRQLGRDVAIKQLSPGLVSDDVGALPVPGRSKGPGVDRPPAHRPSVRLRRARRRLHPGHGTPRWRHRLEPVRRPGVRPADRLCHRAGGVLGPQRRPPPRGPAPRHEAGERALRRGQRAEGDRLRHRPRPRRGRHAGHPGGRDPRYSGLYGARTGQRRRPRAHDRRLCRGRHALRAVVRSASLSRGGRVTGHRPAPHQ